MIKPKYFHEFPIAENPKDAQDLNHFNELEPLAVHDHSQEISEPQHIDRPIQIEPANEFKIFKTMSPESLKTENPEVYNAIFQLGINAEKERASTWLNSGLTNKWEIRDGLKSNLAYKEHIAQELKNFYTPIEERLDGRTSAASPDPQIQKPNIYSKIEANEFYAEVDKRMNNLKG